MKDRDLGVREQTAEIEKGIEKALKEIDLIQKEKSLVKTAEELEALERRIVEATDKLAGALVAQKVQASIYGEELKEEAALLVKRYPKKMKNQGIRDVTIRPSRGEPFTVKTTYFSQKGKRKKNRVGFYPELILSGIHDHCTPLLASEVSLTTVVMSSFEEAETALADRGICLDVSTIRNITVRFAARSKAVQQSESYEFGETVDGRRVVISTDGGRIRIRKNKRGPKTKKGRNRYSTDWREPKLLIIYVVNNEGRMERKFCPFIDGTMKGPDAVFGLLRFYLSKLKLSTADQILFVADGARWIWTRVPQLLEDLGVQQKRAYELVDFYHAVEHLGKVAACCKSWSSGERTKWVKKHKKLLKEGKIRQVTDAITTLCRGRSSKEFRREREYFLRNQDRMNYHTIEGMGLPIGSGAMESAIRRVVNLRLKGPAIYWNVGTAEAMLTLRSYFKAGRWNMLKSQAVTPTLDALI
jgi:hypothetical protein